MPHLETKITAKYKLNEYSDPMSMDLYFPYKFIFRSGMKMKFPRIYQSVRSIKRKFEK